MPNYLHPPIVEALVEFRLPGSPGLTLAQVQEAFPPQAPDLEVSPALEVPLPIASVQFREPGSGRVVSVGPNFVTAHLVGAYPGWAEFRPFVTRVAELLRTLGPVQIVVRYINVIHVPRGEDASRWLAHSVLWFPPPAALTSFDHRQTIAFGGDTAEITYHAADDGREEGVRVVLDIAMAGDVGSDDVMGVVDRLRERERELFEMIIGDEARAAFRPVPEEV